MTNVTFIVIWSLGIYCSINSRRFQSIPSDSKHYIDRDAGNIKMPCAPGTQFSVQNCLCIHEVNSLGQFVK